METQCKEHGRAEQFWLEQEWDLEPHHLGHGQSPLILCTECKLDLKAPESGDML